MYRIYLLPIGTLLLLAYIVLDLIVNRGRNLLRRIVFYSFVFYLLNVLQLTTGGINIPPEPLRGQIYMQLTPFRFLIDWYQVYQRHGVGWWFWNSLRLSVYNLLMLVPLGIYLPLLYRIKSVAKIAGTVFLVSLTIETYQYIFSYFGITMFRQFNVDDLILNTLGGVIGFGIYLGIRRLLPRKYFAFIEQKIEKSN